MKNEQEDASTAGSIDPDPATAAAIAAALNEPPTTRATRSSKRTADAAFPSSLEEQAETKKVRSTANSNNNDVSITEGQMPKAQEHLEEYVEFAANLMLPSPGPDAPSYHSLPTMSALQYLKCPKRQKRVWENWSPYQISLFEAGMAHYGKHFYAIAKEFEGSKSTKEIIDFYYLWKKTSHYHKWKKTYLPPHLDLSDEEAEPRLSGKDGTASSGKAGR